MTRSRRGAPPSGLATRGPTASRAITAPTELAILGLESRRSRSDSNMTRSRLCLAPRVAISEECDPCKDTSPCSAARA